MITLTFSSLGAAFSPNMETFIVIRLAIAASAVAVWTTGFVYSKIFYPFFSLFFPQFSLFLPPIPLFLYSHIPTPWSGIPLRWLKVAILKLPLPLPLLQTAIMEIRAILKAQTDAAAASSKTCLQVLEEAAACTLLIRYIRENFKIATFTHLSGSI